MNALDVLKYGHLHLQRTLSSVPEDQWETVGVCGIWSVKDIVAHLASYEHMLVDVLASVLGETETPTLNKMGELGPEAFNNDQVGQRKDKSWQEVLDEYTVTQQEAAVRAAKIPTATWGKVGTLPWYGAEYSLDDFIVYTFYGHKREHSAEIEVFKTKLKG
jgi:hypothetical protein